MKLVPHRVFWLAATLMAPAGCSEDKTAQAVTADLAASDTGPGTDTAGAPGDDTGQPSTDYPPILITIDVHGHNYDLPYTGDGVEWWRDKRDRYLSDKEQILFVADLAESVGALANFQLNGEYCRDARVLLTEPDTDHLTLLAEGGHVMGSHFHNFRFTGEDEYWESVPKDAATEAVLRGIWNDQVTECETTLGTRLFRIDPAMVSSILDAGDVVNELKNEYGFEVEPVGEIFSYTDWSHKPWNPFRRQLDSKLLEDSTRTVLGLVSLGQVGQLEPEGKHQLMTTVPQIKRHFLAQVAEWREHERQGLPPKVWQFGIMTHPNQNRLYQDEMIEMVTWLAEWTEKTTAQGNMIAEFSTDPDVLARFEAWEEANPGASSFSFDWDAYLAGETVPYPYSLEGLTMGLKDLELDTELDTWRAEGVTVYRLYRRPVLRGAADAEGLREMVISESVDDTALYLMWSNQGVDVEIDVSSEVDGALLQLDSTTGEISTVDSARLVVPTSAVLVSTSFEGTAD